ncbi:MAG: hypothetical protein K9K30_00415 [Burkholderiaceae bacterium]|nr:hypothetical protein [Sulfuritalea sp.]MCF8173693.1 hypothetical protein [Burkholderiaceae bacterium]
MKIKIADAQYLEKAKQLSKEDAERLFSRMRGRLTRRLDDKKLTPLDAIAIQLELEDEELKDWRERLGELRKKDKAKG